MSRAEQDSEAPRLDSEIQNEFRNCQLPHASGAQWRQLIADHAMAIARSSRLVGNAFSAVLLCN